jgi:hypothetical protein
MRRARILSLSVLTLTLLSGPLVGQAVADDRYYVILFASQSEPRRPRLSHTFCTFIKAESASANDPLAEPKFTAQTISWLPVSGDVRVLRLRPERGRNFTLAETLRLVRSTGQSVWSWGPYEVSADIYNGLARQKARLDSGRIGYKALDRRFQGNATNCIHAVTGAIPNWGGFGVPNQMYGVASARYLAERVTQSNQALVQNQDWVLDRLGIRTGTSIRYMAYNPSRNQHLARVPQESGTVVVRGSSGNIGQ